MDEPQNPSAAGAHERAEAALGWIDEDATAAATPGHEWAEQACEELAPASVTGMLLGRRPNDGA